MHIVYFQGGFANQLFQLCFYEMLKSKYGDDNVYADVSRYKKNSDHGGFRLGTVYALQYLNILPQSYVEVSELNYEYIVVNPSDNYYYKGYWQNKKYFPQDNNFIRDIVNLSNIKGKKLELLNLIESKNSVSVHVRRGDYVDHFLHGNIANKAYFINAIAYMKRIMEEPSFFIFSDDIEWCKNNIIIDDSEVYYVKGNSKHVEEDMAMMSMCKHNIISNSSYSWWGQKLNNNENKTVISPEYWFNEPNENVDLNEGFIHVRNVPEVSGKFILPKFSFIVPVFNGEATLRRCLSSILNQQYSNIEIIIIDDGSTDGSVELIKNYKKNDSRVKLIQNKENKGPLTSRIQGMKNASGEYILFVDSDDYISETMCDVLFKIIDHAKMDVIEFRYMIEPSGRIIDNPISFHDMVPYVLERKCPHTMWNKCYSKELVERFLKNAESYYCLMAEDVYFTLLFLKLANSYKKVKDVLYHYVTVDGITSSKKLCLVDVKKMAESLKNRDVALHSFFRKQNNVYESKISIGTYNDIIWLSDLFMRLSQPIGERLELIECLDSLLGTSIRKDYDNMIDESICLHNSLKKGTKKERIKNYIKTGIELFKEMLII